MGGFWKELMVDLIGFLFYFFILWVIFEWRGFDSAVLFSLAIIIWDVKQLHNKIGGGN